MPLIDNAEEEALQWLERVTGDSLSRNQSFQDTLKDGTVLCRALNNVFPQMKVKYAASTMPFKQMENISVFLHGLSKVAGFRSFDLFTTVDLYEGKNLEQVRRCILACKRLAEKSSLGVLAPSPRIHTQPPLTEEPSQVAWKSTKTASNSDIFEQSSSDNVFDAEDVFSQSNAENAEDAPRTENAPHAENFGIASPALSNDTDIFYPATEQQSPRQETECVCIEPVVELIDSPPPSTDDYFAGITNDMGTFQIEVSE